LACRDALVVVIRRSAYLEPRPETQGILFPLLLSKSLSGVRLLLLVVALAAHLVAALVHLAKLAL
jgi:hypothetical protein